MGIRSQRRRSDVPPGPTAAATVSKLIEGQLAEERATKTSLESRAVTVITSSGTIVTLLLALGSLVAGLDDYPVPAMARGLLVLALFGFVDAIVTAVLVARPRPYFEVTHQGLQMIATSTWFSRPNSHVELDVAKAQVGIITAARKANKEKAKLLSRAITAEVVAISLLALAVAVILVVGAT